MLAEVDHLGVLFLGPLGRDSGSAQCQMLPVTDPGTPAWSYQVDPQLVAPSAEPVYVQEE